MWTLADESHRRLTIESNTLFGKFTLLVQIHVSPRSLPAVHSVCTLKHNLGSVNGKQTTRFWPNHIILFQPISNRGRLCPYTQDKREGSRANMLNATTLSHCQEGQMAKKQSKRRSKEQSLKMKCYGQARAFELCLLSNINNLSPESLMPPLTVARSSTKSPSHTQLRSCVVTYSFHYQIRSPDGKSLKHDTPHHVNC